METSGGKQRRISLAERDHVWMDTVEKDMLHILYVIGIAHVTSREAL